MKLKAKNCIIVAVGSIILAFGLYNIHSISNVTEGGVLGLTLLFEHWFGISPALSSLALNIICYIFGYKVLGKDFIGYSVVSALVYSGAYALFELNPPIYPPIADMPLAAALIGALFVGIGAGLCVRMGGATSGDDALAMGLEKISGMGIQWIYLISDVTVLLLSLTYIPFGRIIYSLLTVLISGQIIGFIQNFKSKDVRRKKG